MAWWISAMGSLGKLPSWRPGATGKRKPRLPPAVARPPPSMPMKPILSHVPRRKGWNSMLPTRDQAGAQASMADRRFIESPRGLNLRCAAALEPRCQFFQRRFADHFVSYLFVANATAHGFVELRQEVKGNVRGLEIPAFSMTEIMHQRPQSRLSRRRNRRPTLCGLRGVHSCKHTHGNRLRVTFHAGNLPSKEYAAVAL